MAAPVEITVFPRLDCCVPDYTGKNRLLAQVLSEAKQSLGDKAHVEVVPIGSRFERISYYERMLEALIAGGQPLPFPVGPEPLAQYREAARLLASGLAPSPSALAVIREMSVHFFRITPIIALDGRAVFVTTVPTAAELSQAVDLAVARRAHSGR